MISRIFILSFAFYLLLFSFSHLYSDVPAPPKQILFLVQQGKTTKAIELYNQYHKLRNKHDFELLHKIGLGIVENGFVQSDPEIQLLSLFGASVMAHDEAFPIIEQSMKNSYPQIQLVALKSLAQYKNDRATQILLQALASNQLLIRFEAANELCKMKHPQAVSQTECLFYKVPKQLRSLFPPLFAAAGTEKGTKILKKLINDSSEAVRLSVLLSAAKYNRDDLLPQIRQQASHINYINQEACAYALGQLKDNLSVKKLEDLAQSQYPHVQLSANKALYLLGHTETIEPIKKMAQDGDIFAIQILGELGTEKEILKDLQLNKDIQIRVNATIALLNQKDPSCFSTLPEILLRNKYDLAFKEVKSAGQTLKAIKTIPSASQILKDDVSAFMGNLEIREQILSKAKALSDESFITLSNAILNSHQNDLVPIVIESLEEMASPAAIALLKNYQQKVGAPFVRAYCNLALYRMHEEGPYKEILYEWAKKQNKEAIIRFLPFTPWEFDHSNHELTPEETSKLLIEVFETFAANQDDHGIQALLDAIQNGHEKNKYALAGLLIRATE